eukprot:7102354-Prymnesium_polylepis.1
MALKNGGSGEGYKWGQTLEEVRPAAVTAAFPSHDPPLPLFARAQVTLHVPIGDGVRAKMLQVDIRRSRLHVVRKGGD